MQTASERGLTDPIKLCPCLVFTLTVHEPNTKRGSVGSICDHIDFIFYKYKPVKEAVEKPSGEFAHRHRLLSK